MFLNMGRAGDWVERVGRSCLHYKEPTNGPVVRVDAEAYARVRTTVLHAIPSKSSEVRRHGLVVGGDEDSSPFGGIGIR